MTVSVQNAQTIGVITGLDLVGDALIKLPFLRALRHAFPNTKIHWITTVGTTTFASQLREVTQSLIDVIHQQPAWLKANSAEKPPFFDILIDTRSRRSEILPTRKIVPHKLYLCRSTFFLFSDRRPSLFSPRPKHLSDRLLQLAALAAGYTPPSNGSLQIPQKLADQAQSILPDGPIYIGIAPGCSTPRRMWPLERFIEVAKAQLGENRVPVFILGPMESKIIAELKMAVPEAKFPLQDCDAWGEGPISINHTLALGPRLTLAVTNDSGPGHMMAAVGCPVLSLFGPTTPLKAAPRVAGGRSISAQIYGAAQMDSIPVDAVCAAINTMIQENSPQP